MCINTSSHWELHTASLVSQTLKLHTAEGHLSWKTALSINRLTRLSNHLSSLPSLLISRAIDIVSVLRRFPWKTVTACSLLLLTLSSYGSFSFILKYFLVVKIWRQTLLAFVCLAMSCLFYFFHCFKERSSPEFYYVVWLMERTGNQDILVLFPSFFWRIFLLDMEFLGFQFLISFFFFFFFERGLYFLLACVVSDKLAVIIVDCIKCVSLLW